MEFWFYSIIFGVGELIIGFFLRLIRLTDHTTEKLDAFRARRAEEIRQFYADVPGPRQWEMNSLDTIDK
jgi:Ca2+-transporting ATPase